jgi:hypothetical protein
MLSWLVLSVFFMVLVFMITLLLASWYIGKKSEIGFVNAIIVLLKGYFLMYQRATSKISAEIIFQAAENPRSKEKIKQLIEFSKMIDFAELGGYVTYSNGDLLFDEYASAYAQIYPELLKCNTLDDLHSFLFKHDALITSLFGISKQTIKNIRWKYLNFSFRNLWTPNIRVFLRSLKQMYLVYTLSYERLATSLILDYFLRNKTLSTTSISAVPPVGNPTAEYSGIGYYETVLGAKIDADRVLREFKEDFRFRSRHSYFPNWNFSYFVMCVGQGEVFVGDFHIHPRASGPSPVDKSRSKYVYEILLAPLETGDGFCIWYLDGTKEDTPNSDIPHREIKY